MFLHPCCQSIKLKLIVMFTILEYRERQEKKKEREIQRKGESRRQAIEAQRGKERQRAGARDKKQRRHYFIYTSHHFTPHGRYELNKLTSLPMCGYIAQLVEQRTGNAEVTGSNPVEALIFSGFFFPIA